MNKYFLVLILIVMSLTSMAQKKPALLKKKVIVTPQDTMLYPIRGTFRISEAGSAVAKNLEFWVFDAKNREIYYVAQGIPITDGFADMVYKMIDKEYTFYMMKHGHVICKK